MEPEGSLPQSEVPATCPYPEPARSSPHTPTSWRSISILSSHLRLGLPSGLFLSGYPTKPLQVTVLKFICSYSNATRCPRLNKFGGTAVNTDQIPCIWTQPSPYDKGSNNFKPFVYCTDLPGISSTVNLYCVNNTWAPFWDGAVIWLLYSKRMCKLCCIRVERL